jgi:hypothetical protein
MRTNSNTPNPNYGDMGEEFDAYELLPPRVRHALAHAPFKTSAYSLRSKGWSEERMLQAIEAKAAALMREHAGAQ